MEDENSNRLLHSKIRTMKTAEEIIKEIYDYRTLKGAWDDFKALYPVKYLAILSAMEEYRQQPSASQPMSAEQYSSGAIHSLGEFPTTKSMSAEQVELGYYYPLFKFFSDEHGLTLLDSQLQDVIHECKKFIEPATTGGNWKSEYDNCRALLQELVSLKVMKENLYKGSPDGKEYAERKPKAWQAAQQFLNTAPTVKAEGWVSVEDKLPEVLETVWVSNGKGWTALGCRTDYYENDEGGFDWCWAGSNGIIYEESGKIVSECEEDDLDVRFWHPLPEPPATK